MITNLVYDKADWWIHNKSCLDLCWYIPYTDSNSLYFQFQYDITPDTIECPNILQEININIRRCCDDSIITSLDTNRDTYFYGQYNTKVKPWQSSIEVNFQNFFINYQNLCNLCTTTTSVFTVTLSQSQMFGSISNICEVQINGNGFDINNLPPGYTVTTQNVGNNNVLITISVVGCFFGSGISLLFCDPNSEDTNLFPMDLDIQQAENIFNRCFYFEFITSDGILFSQPYKCVACEDSVQLEGVFECFDMQGLFYGYPNQTPICGNSGDVFDLKYRNILTVRGAFKQTSTSLTKVFDKENCYTYKSEIKKIYTLKTEYMPLWYAQEVMELLSAKTVLIEGLSYNLVDEYRIQESQINGFSMVQILAEFQSCKSQLVFGCSSCN